MPRLAIAMPSHEGNSFTPVPTVFASITDGGLVQRARQVGVGAFRFRHAPRSLYPLAE